MSWIPLYVPQLSPPDSLIRYVHLREGYQIELTNFEDVFCEEVTDITHKAESFGIEDLTPEAAQKLRQKLEDMFRTEDINENKSKDTSRHNEPSKTQNDKDINKKEKVSLRDPTPPLKSTMNPTTLNPTSSNSLSSPFNISLTGDILSISPRTSFKWVFLLKRKTSEKKAMFFARLSKHQMFNHALLVRQVAHLKTVVDIKDSYIKFLYENFRLSHGSEAVDKYGENHVEDKPYLLPFDEERWKRDFEDKIVREKTSEWEAVVSAATDVVWSQSKRQLKHVVTDTESESDSEEDGFYSSPLKKPRYDNSREIVNLLDSIPDMKREEKSID